MWILEVVYPQKFMGGNDGSEKNVVATSGNGFPLYFTHTELGLGIEGLPVLQGPAVMVCMATVSLARGGT